jgi:hypothetical protein
MSDLFFRLPKEKDKPNKRTNEAENLEAFQLQVEGFFFVFRFHTKHAEDERHKQKHICDESGKEPKGEGMPIEETEECV